MKLNHNGLYADRDSGPERAHLFNGDKASERNTPLSLSLFPALPRSSALIPPIDLRRRRRKKAKSASAAAEAFSHERVSERALNRRLARKK